MVVLIIRYEQNTLGRVGKVAHMNSYMVEPILGGLYRAGTAYRVQEKSNVGTREYSEGSCQVRVRSCQVMSGKGEVM